MFNLITGVYVPTAGTIQFQGKTLNKMKPNKFVREGIARAFQNILLFKKMSALENVMSGFHCRTKADMFSIVLELRKVNREKKETIEKSVELLKYVGIDNSGTN